MTKKERAVLKELLWLWCRESKLHGVNKADVDYASGLRSAAVDVSEAFKLPLPKPRRRARGGAP